MRNLPTGTVTLLFTDMEGSTRLLQQLGERYVGVLADCRQLLRTAFIQYNGHEVDTQGDAFFVVFVRATDAAAEMAWILDNTELTETLCAEGLVKRAGDDPRTSLLLSSHMSEAHILHIC